MVQDFDITFIDRDDAAARFVVRGVTPAIANGVRRSILADVPTFSIDTVRFIENSSVMFDEMIGLRLGLVPLTTPPGEFEPGESVTLALDAEGPTTAYSGDLKSSDEMVVPAETSIPIIELKEGQRIELEADAVLARGKEHAKHQGGVAVGYRHLQRTRHVEDRGEFDEPEPQIVRGVIEEGAAEHATDAEVADGDLVLTASFDHDLTTRYPDAIVEVVDVPGAVVFHVETDGSFSVTELVEQAIRSLGDRAAELQTKLTI
jgi:DNA-directed RNA polymerase, subunit D (EC 2.7.7.6)